MSAHSNEFDCFNLRGHGAAQLGTSPVGGGVATVTTTSLTAGAHTITASYSGASGYLASVSGVQPASPPTILPASGLHITVNRAVPNLTWAVPASITVGTPLGATQLDATASVPGTFTYAPPVGTLLAAGNGQILSVVFTPSDTTDYA